MKRIALLVSMMAMCAWLTQSVQAEVQWLVRAGYDAFAAQRAIEQATALLRTAEGARSPLEAAKLAEQDPALQQLLVAYNRGYVNPKALPGGVSQLLQSMSMDSRTLAVMGSCGKECEAAAKVLQDVEAAGNAAAVGNVQRAKVLGYDDYTMVSFVGGEYAMPTRDLQPAHLDGTFQRRPVNGPLQLVVDGEKIEIPNGPLTEAVMKHKPDEILVEVSPTVVEGQFDLDRVWVQTGDGWVQLEQGARHEIHRMVVGPPTP